MPTRKSANPMENFNLIPRFYILIINYWVSEKVLKITDFHF